MIKPLLVEECETLEFRSIIREFEEMVNILVANRKRLDTLCGHGAIYAAWRGFRKWSESRFGPGGHYLGEIFRRIEKGVNLLRAPRAALDSDRIIHSSRVNANRFWEYPFSLRSGDVLSGPKLDILDAGGGWSLLPMYLTSRLGHKVTSVDLDELKMRYFSPALASFFGAAPQYKVEDLTALNFGDNTFDRVFCVSVLEHIEEETDEKGRRVNRHSRSLDVAAIREMLRVLKPSGLLVLTIEWSEDPSYGRPYTLPDVKDRLLAPFRAYLLQDTIPTIDWEVYKENPRRIWKDYYPHRENFFMSSLGIILKKTQ